MTSSGITRQSYHVLFSFSKLHYQKFKTSRATQVWQSVCFSTFTSSLPLPIKLRAQLQTLTKFYHSLMSWIWDQLLCKDNSFTLREFDLLGLKTISESTITKQDLKNAKFWFMCLMGYGFHTRISWFFFFFFNLFQEEEFDGAYGPSKTSLGYVIILSGSRVLDIAAIILFFLRQIYIRQGLDDRVVATTVFLFMTCYV